MPSKSGKSKVWKWVLGLVYILCVAAIWIAASFVVQSVVDAGVSPFLITYICNSLFLIYIPIFEIGRYLDDSYGGLLFWLKGKSSPSQELGESEEVILLQETSLGTRMEGSNSSMIPEEGEADQQSGVVDERMDIGAHEPPRTLVDQGIAGGEVEGLDAKGRWTRVRVAKASLLIGPFWFLAQLTFNLSLEYTSVTSNTILSSSSSLFTFLISVAVLGEKFTWVKLASVSLCMAGTVIVSLGDTKATVKRAEMSAVSSKPHLGDILALVSASLYAVYITLIRKKLPDDGDDDDDDNEKSNPVSMAQFLGYLGFFNLVIFLPVALLLHFTKLEPFTNLTWKQLSLVVGKGLLDNVLSDYLWAKAVFLTTTTVATAGLTIQVPLAAIVDTLIGRAPPLSDYLGAVAVMIGFAGINIPSETFKRPEQPTPEMEGSPTQSPASSAEQNAGTIQQAAPNSLTHV